MRILRLNKVGNPLGWITKEHAAELYCKGNVVWELGNDPLIITGGVNNNGIRSELYLAPVIASSGKVKSPTTVPLTNQTLFRRDNNTCMYCGGKFPDRTLTREHIYPRGYGGKDVWENVVAACLNCNSNKGCRTPEEAGLELLAVPFRPNLFEYMYLTNRRILGDQMEYLQTRFNNDRGWAA